MNQLKNLIQFAVVIIIATACSTNTKDESLLTVNFDKLEEKSIPLSELVETIDIVFLESSEVALINSPSGFAVSDDYILITDYRNVPAKLFSSKGAFILDMGTIGKGPDEYASVINPFIDTENSTFSVQLGGNYSHANEGWCYVYNKDGDLTQKLRTPLLIPESNNYNSALVHQEYVIVPGNAESEYLLAYTKQGDTLIHKIDNLLPADYFTYMTNNSTVYPANDGHVICHIGESDTVYKVDLKTGITTPVLSIKNESHRFNADLINAARKVRDFEQIQKASKGGYSISLLGENRNYYFFSLYAVGSDAGKQIVFANKNTGEAFVGAIKNDFLGNINLEKVPEIYKNEYFIIHYPAIEFLDILNKHEFNFMSEIIEKMEDLNKPLTENSNDVILICKLK